MKPFLYRCRNAENVAFGVIELETLHIFAQLVGQVIRQFLAGRESVEGTDFVFGLAIDLAGALAFVVRFAAADEEEAAKQE